MVRGDDVLASELAGDGLQTGIVKNNLMMMDGAVSSCWQLETAF